ncbi:ABC-type nitrate/sulfonate/bicarbonate transport system permease component [Paraburkholderia sp. JPY465]|uniref:ABC transporter permease n=1 Tax=Paraburkholderia sp. JPY465 TaxID=3042285 RepID=UPI003D1BE705
MPGSDRVNVIRADEPPRAAHRGHKGRGGRAIDVLRHGAGFANRWALVITLLLLWQAGSGLGWINPNAFPAPLTIGRTIVALAASGDLEANLWSSITRVFVGVAAAGVAGIALGMLCARYARLAFYLTPPIELVRPISVIAWIPVAIIWFGLGDASAWFIIALGAFFPIFTNTFAAMKQIPPVYLRAAQTLGLDRRQLLLDVLWPAALPGVLSGIRIGLGVGWMCVIAAEMIASTAGLGYMIQTARVMIETEQVFAGMIVIGVVGFLMNLGMVAIEQRVTRWQPRGL